MLRVVSVDKKHRRDARDEMAQHDGVFLPAHHYHDQHDCVSAFGANVEFDGAAHHEVFADHQSCKMGAHPSVHSVSACVCVRFSVAPGEYNTPAHHSPISTCLPHLPPRTHRRCSSSATFDRRVTLTRESRPLRPNSPTCCGRVKPDDRT